MNSVGRVFRVTTFGESHGPAIGCVVDGCPASLPLTKEDIQIELEKRKPVSEVSTARREQDRAELLSGVFEGKTLGTPIAILVRNKETRSQDYDAFRNIARPGHADYTYFERYGLYDHRGGGRSSGRETVARVAAGAVAKRFLSHEGVKIRGYVKSVGSVSAGEFDEIDLAKVYENDMRTVPKYADAMRDEVLKAKKEGDSLGGIIELIARIPAGLGSPVFGKLDADISSALMGIGSVKGVEFGSGFSCAKMRGSESNDPFEIRDQKIGTSSNNAGGVLGGISSGMPFVVRFVVKPTSSIGKRQKTVDFVRKKEETIEIKGRHDACIAPRILPVAEAMLAIVLADHVLLKRCSHLG